MKLNKFEKFSPEEQQLRIFLQKNEMDQNSSAKKKLGYATGWVNYQSTKTPALSLWLD